MSSPVSAVGAVTGPPAPLAPITADRADAASGAGFGDMIGKAIAGAESAQDKASDLAVKAATGDLDDASQYLAAATEAQLTTQLTVAVRNKAVEAFNEIMRLQA